MYEIGLSEAFNLYIYIRMYTVCHTTAKCGKRGVCYVILYLLRVNVKYNKIIYLSNRF